VILDGRGGLKLISRNGYDRTKMFRSPFRDLIPIDREMVFDGEIAVPDNRGVTHISNLQDTIVQRRPEGLTYFAFDVLHLDGHDLRACPIEERKALLRALLEGVRCPRIVYVDHVIGDGADLFEHVEVIGAEGIVSKRLGSRYSAGPSSDWRKTKCHAVGPFVITGFRELGTGRLEALDVAENLDGGLVPVGEVRFGFAGKGLWKILDRLRSGPTRRGVVWIEPWLTARVKFFGRYKGGFIRDGVLLDLDKPQPLPASSGWACDADAAIAAMDAAR
jgi:bifunctional non-homologous end joining protein LigD